MNKLKILLSLTILLVAAVPPAAVANQESREAVSYEAIIMNTDMIMNTRQSTFAKIHSVKVLKLSEGAVRIVFNVELTKTDGTFEYEQYEQTLQPGSDWYNQSVTNGQLLDVRE